MSFRIAIIDDTDDATLENIKPIYDFLYSKGIVCTKTVWVYPPRDKPSNGDSLQRSEYLEYIKELNNKGFEIALHNIGSGDYLREEILNGWREFHEKLGFKPRIHINHSYNKDSIYGGQKRFNWPFNKIIKLLYPQYGGEFSGEDQNSKYFWGDIHKTNIQFNRNHEFRSLNTLKTDPLTPYIDPKRCEYSNYWFSSTFAPNQIIFNNLLSKRNIDRLHMQNGTSIIFTHFGYFMKNGKIDKNFVDNIEYLVSKSNAKFLTVSDLLKEIVNERKSKGKAEYPVIKWRQKFRLEFLHLLTRIYYRKINKIDDYAYKNLNKDMFLEKR